MGNIYIIPNPNLIEKSCEIANKYGAGFEYNDFYEPALLDDEKALEERISLYQGLGRPKGKDTLHGVFYDICVNSADSKIAGISKDRMKQSMEIARRLNCKGVIFHTNVIPGFEPEFYLNGWLKDNANYYRELLSEYPDIEIYVENMFDYKPDMLYRLAKELSDEHRFGVCYDVSHSHVHDVCMEKWIELLAPYIKHLHINDNDGNTDQHKSVGSGTIDWKKYFILLSEYKIDTRMLIEVKDSDSQIESLEYLIKQELI